MKLSLTVDTRQAEDALKRLGDMAPVALSIALTKTAEAARMALNQEMALVFDRPTPFTFKAIRVIDARASKLQADVFFKDEGGKGLQDAKTRYSHQVFGGARAIKPMEFRLRRIGLLGVNEMAVPGAAAKLDAYGNMARSQIVQILSWFEAFGEAGYTANSTKATREKKAKGTRSRYGQRFFLKRDKPGRGIYLATKTGFSGTWAIQPVLMFVSRGQYRARLNFEGVVLRTHAQQFPLWFEDAARKVMGLPR